MVADEGVVIRPGGGQHHLPMTKDGAKSMATFLGLPWNLAAKLRQETFGALSTELLGQKQRYDLMLQNGSVTSVAKHTGHRSLNPARVLTALESGVKGLEYHRVLILPNYTVCIEMVGERREAVVAEDMIQAGVQMMFSPIGTIEPVIRGYVLRLLCTNGMTSNTIIREFSYGGGGGGGGGAGGDSGGSDIWPWIRNSAKASYNSLDKIVAQYRKMMDEQIPANQRASMLEALMKEAKITGADAIAIRAMAIENPPQTSYDLMNLLSDATSHLLESPRQIVVAQKAVADYSSESEHSRICPVCRSKRGTTSSPSRN